MSVAHISADERSGPMPPGPRITIRLTPALDALVSDRVRQGSNVSDIVREALEAYLGVRQIPRQTQETSASARAAVTSDTVADALSDSRVALLSDVSDIRERLAHLEQRVEELSASVRQYRMLSDTQAIVDMPTSRTADPTSDISLDTVSDTLSDIDSDARQTPEARASSPETAILSDTDVPLFDPNKFVLGKLCPRRHEYYGIGKTLRRLFRHVCPQCDVERTREARKARREGAP